MSSGIYFSPLLVFHVAYNLAPEECFLHKRAIKHHTYLRYHGEDGIPGRVQCQHVIRSASETPAHFSLVACQRLASCFQQTSLICLKLLKEKEDKLNNYQLFEMVNSKRSILPLKKKKKVNRDKHTSTIKSTN